MKIDEVDDVGELIEGDNKKISLASSNLGSKPGIIELKRVELKKNSKTCRDKSNLEVMCVERNVVVKEEKRAEEPSKPNDFFSKLFNSSTTHKQAKEQINKSILTRVDQNLNKNEKFIVKPIKLETAKVCSRKLGDKNQY